MQQLKDFCIEAMTEENRRYYAMGYEAAVQDHEISQKDIRDRQAADAIIAFSLLVPLAIAILGDIMTGGFFVKFVFSLMTHSTCTH